MSKGKKNLPLRKMASFGEILAYGLSTATMFSAYLSPGGSE